MMISICVTIKNRSRVKTDQGELLLFPKCVQSILAAVPTDIPCELIVADWGSDDWPLAEWLGQAAKSIPVKVIPVSGAFSRGRGRNIAAAAAQGDYLMFVDADCLLSREVFDSGIKYLQENQAYFPVLYSFDSPGHKNGWWRHEGFGNCMVTKGMFELIGGWPDYEVWGKEDDDFHSKIAAHVKVVREEVPGFYHQWHPEDVVWKNRYSPRAEDIANEVNQVRKAAAELSGLVPVNQILILVDESRFGSSPVAGRICLPMTEFEGEYAGPPSDDAAALKEFKRLCDRGASFIAFAWMAFWWLDHYRELDQFIRSNFDCVLENERLIVFDLQKRKGASLKKRYSG